MISMTGPTGSTPCCLVTVTALLIVAATGERPAAAAEPAFQVIVHPEVAGTQISRTVLAAIFVAYVAETEGAIGYVTPSAALPAAVKAIAVVD